MKYILSLFSYLSISYFLSPFLINYSFISFTGLFGWGRERINFQIETILFFYLGKYYKIRPKGSKICTHFVYLIISVIKIKIKIRFFRYLAKSSSVRETKTECSPVLFHQRVLLKSIFFQIICQKGLIRNKTKRFH